MIVKATRLNNVQEYYFSSKLREVAELKNSGKPIINIGIGSPDLSPPEEVVEVLVEAMNQPNVHQYQSYQGIPELRMAMAEFYKDKYNVALNPATEILPLMGSKEGIMHISMAFLNKGDQVLIPNPGYPTYASVTKLVEAEPIYYDLDIRNNWLPDLALLEESDLSKVKIMWLNYPHMPTGALADTTFFTDLVAFAKRNNIMLVNDNPYSFILNENPLSILEIKGAIDIALELNSLSKTFNMAGWRVGMAVGNSKLLKAILQVKSNMDSGMFLGIQQGAVKALASRNKWFSDLNNTYEQRRKVVWKIFDALGCTYDKASGGLFVWAKIPEDKETQTFTDELLYNKSIFITPGTVFGTKGVGFIRASLCVSEDKLREVLNRLSSQKN